MDGINAMVYHLKPLTFLSSSSLFLRICVNLLVTPQFMTIVLTVDPFLTVIHSQTSFPIKTQVLASINLLSLRKLKKKPQAINKCD